MLYSDLLYPPPPPQEKKKKKEKKLNFIKFVVVVEMCVCTIFCGSVFQPGLLPVGCPRSCRDMAEGLCTSSPALVSDPLGHRASHAPGGQGVHQKLRVEEQGDAVSVRAFDLKKIKK